jgi:V-type H+-transporting ATPase subunit C
MSYWLISVPSGGQMGNAKDIETTLKNSLPGEVGVGVLNVPTLKVGTLDSLMSLSDDLERVDRYVESVVHRLEKEIRNLINSDANLDRETPSQRESRERQVREMRFIEPGNMAAEDYLRKFKWDEFRYGIKSTLPELVKDIQDLIQRTDEDLKVKQGDYMQIKSALQAAARKSEGNLANRSLVEVVERYHVVTSDRLDSVFCAVPKSGVPEFLEKYALYGKVPANDHPKRERDRFVLHEIEALERDYKDSQDAPEYQKRKQALMEQQLNMQVNAVVPDSAELVTEDTEFALYRVVIFKSARQSFELDINSKSSVRIIVRDYTYREGQLDADRAEVTKLEADEKDSKKELKRWCISYFSEAYRAWIHLKTIRVFVESVLRYGLPPKMVAMLIKPGRHEDKTRKTLNTLYDALSAGMGKGEDSEEKGFYSYVNLEIRYTSETE